MSGTTTPLRSRGPAAGAEPAPPGPARLVGVELRKAYDTRAGAWLLVAVAVAAVAVVVLQVFFDPPARSLAGHLTGAQLPVGVLLPVLGILLVTSEWSARTAGTTFGLVPRRSRVLAAKVAAAGVLAVLAVAASALVAVAGTLLTPVVTDDPADWTLTAGQVGQVLVVQVATVLVGVAFGMLLLSSPLAIVLYFVLPTAFTVLVNAVAALHWVRDWLDLTSTSAPMYEGLLEGRGWLRLATSLALWLLLPMAVGWVRVLRRDVP